MELNLNTPKIIIFNSYPGGGKDEATKYLVRQYGCLPFSFKESLIRITLELYQIPRQTWDSWYSRTGKELPREELDGKSCREALIFVSEVIVKPYFGKDYFGKTEAKRLWNMCNSGNAPISACCSDGGFKEEVVPFTELFGKENVFICKITRPGYSWGNDSRNWITAPEIPIQNYYTISNDRGLDDFWKNLDDLYSYVINSNS